MRRATDTINYDKQLPLAQGVRFDIYIILLTKRIWRPVSAAPDLIEVKIRGFATKGSQFGERGGGDLVRSGMPEFESSRSSQPVLSLRRDFRVCENRRHSGGLGTRARASGEHFPDSRS